MGWEEGRGEEQEVSSKESEISSTESSNEKRVL